MKGLTARQAEYVYSKCKNEDIIGIEQIHKCEWNSPEKNYSRLSPCKCAMLNDFELYNVHSESDEIDK